MAKSPKKQGPTAQERELSRVSSAQWSDYVSRYRPAEEALIKKSEFSAGEKARVRGEASADTAAAFKGLTRNTIASGEVAGAAVDSGKTKMGLAGAALARGAASGVGQSVAVTGGNIDSDQQRLKLTGIGRQIATDATADLSRGARRATSLALAASQAKFEKNQALVQGVMTVAGAATEKYRLSKEKKAETAKHRRLEAGGTTPWVQSLSNKDIGAEWLDVDFTKIGLGP